MALALASIKKIYFVGIGGIGMSALARYFNYLGAQVLGYDKTETALTKKLVEEGMHIHYTEQADQIPADVDLAVYTPAIPAQNSELQYFQAAATPLLKRSELLGLISKERRTIAVAGTHGKTSTSSILTHLLRSGGIDCTAFLGGIANNLGSNFVAGSSDWVVLEADEFDRSFLHLRPEIGIITSTDADHLDIYGEHTQLLDSFNEFAALCSKQLFLAQGTEIEQEGIEAKIAHYSASQLADYQASRIRAQAPNFVFDAQLAEHFWEDLNFSLPGRHNVENALAAIAVALELGLSEEQIRQGLRSFRGIWRRFEWVVKQPNKVFIDDYAHHPTELKAAIRTARSLFPKRKLVGIFQPHLFSRSRDFMDGFAAALDGLDQLYLLDIYPAREEPIEGVDSAAILARMQLGEKELVSKAELLAKLAQDPPALLLSLGAGDIGALVPKIAEEIYHKTE